MEKYFPPFFERFDNLDIFIGHIIANMLAEADKIHKNCPENLYKINIFNYDEGIYDRRGIQ